VFGAGEYAPATPEGRRLLAHELTHVVQQGFAAFESPARLAVEASDHPAERQARAGQPLAGSRLSVRLQRAPLDADAGAGGAAPASSGSTPIPPFLVTFNDCSKAPYSLATVQAAARAAYDKVVTSGCVGSEDLKLKILKEFNGLSIDCEQGDSDSPCGRASRYFTQTVNIFPKSLEPARCGPLESTILHEAVHLTEWRLFGHGDLADGCEKACFGYGHGDASKCK
jgi:hypothetical protein